MSAPSSAVAHLVLVRSMRTLFLAIFLSLVSMSGAVPDPSAYLQGGNNWTAVDVKGNRFDGRTYQAKYPPWIADRVTALAPEYPLEERRAVHEGTGFFRLTIDARTGSVISVDLVKSTGFRKLDACAVAALRQWRWKPGKWREISLAVKFTIHDVSHELLPNPIRLHGS